MTQTQVERAASAMERVKRLYDAAHRQGDSAKLAYWGGIIEGGRCMLDHVFGPEHRFRVELHLKEQYGLELPHPDLDMMI